MRDARACGWQIVNSEWRTARTKSNQRSQVNKRTALNKLLFALGSWSALLFALTFPASAQQPKKIPRIGFLAETEGPNIEAFRRGLRELGYIEGKNILV